VGWDQRFGVALKKIKAFKANGKYAKDIVSQKTVYWITVDRQYEVRLVECAGCGCAAYLWDGERKREC